MNYFLALLFIGFVFLIGIIPFSIIYGVSDLVRFFLFRVFKYRRVVVEKNLRESFPDRSEKEIQELVSKFYTNLSDV
ncbi:MAG: acetyltransferase, partial [Bacteroidales bacterium]